MLVYPQIDPIAFHLGPLAVHWYGLMYLFGFAGCWSALALRIKYSTFSRCLTIEQLTDVLFYAALGIILGGRVGYMLFYAWPDLMANPLEIVKIWQGGMSFHGGLIGVMLAVAFYAYRTEHSFVDIMDFIAPAVPIGLAAGRLGNFINGELWGRVTNVSWGMVFPDAGELPRHPSQLYEFFFEGVVLFALLWFFGSKPRPRWAVSGLFLLGYGLIRFMIEFVREPDSQMGFVAFGWMTKGQILCLPMIFFGCVMLMWAYWIRKIPCKST